MRCGGILIATVTLIIILLLFKRISLRIQIDDEARLSIDTGLITLILSDFKSKKGKIPDFLPLFHAVKILLRGSSLHIERLILSNFSTMTESFGKQAVLYIFGSSLIPLAAQNARRVSYTDNAYLTDVCENNLPDVSVRLDFFLIRLIISLFAAVYYKIKYTIKRGLKNAG